ncbi:DUF1642 domain-containing protein [Lactococcus petauri]|uniref:DUF1642 domain-containing protein n=1 Tax=Lactococcus petauri TaxID=1940789 RepID=UPI0018A9DED0|nr:DUF1642 domain-containing protein [Lactococcus petauri]
MKKFEEELKSGPVMIDRYGAADTPVYDEGTLIGYFKDWVSPEDHQAEIDKLKSQLEKQQPEIPEFVAKFIKYTADPIYEISAWAEHYGDNGSKCDDPDLAKTLDWFGMNRNLFYKAVVNGYTVAKEKRFYLKNKLTGLNLVEEKEFSLTGKHVGERFREFEMQYIPTDEQEARLYKNTFTQQEIDSMETGSYEQIEVGE